MQKSFEFNGQAIAAGSRTTVDLALPRLNSRTNLTMPVHIIHGRQSGPRLFVSSSVHGDEINGIEICQRLLEHKSLRYLRGTLMVVPVVNVYGVIHQSRYLPDRRDLNRSFPGSEKGSLAARVAYLFANQVLARCTHGIDLHTGAIHRSNLPQIRADLSDEEAARLAHSFGAPVILDSALREGSMRECAVSMGVATLLYESGEALRFDELCIRAGLQGIINVMRELGMLRRQRKRQTKVESVVAHASKWLRAPESGLLRGASPLGVRVERGDLLGQISDPYSQESVPVVSPYNGIVIGRTEIPLVHEGEGLFHIARFRGDIEEVVETLDVFEQVHSDDDEELVIMDGEG